MTDTPKINLTQLRADAEQWRTMNQPLAILPTGQVLALIDTAEAAKALYPIGYDNHQALKRLRESLDRYTHE